MVRRRTRWISDHTITFTAVLLVLAGMFSFLGMAAASASGTASGIPLGDYAGNNDPSGIAAFGSATGTHPTLATDYLVGSSGWSGMDSASGLSAWKSSGYRLVLGVPILPDGTGGTLASGAAGAYNSYFVTLAQNLVSQGLSNAILRLGWEFNGNWYNWSVANPTDAANFAAFWRNIVTSMRSVSGQDFSFLWNPNGSGPTTYTPDEAYPGSAYVDYIGTDIYDNCWCTPQTPQNAWSAQLSQPWGLNWLASFAAQEGKPIAFPEWSDDFRSDGHGLGDDPYFINQFASWIASNNVAFTDIFAFDGPDQQNDITDGSFPNALAAFKADFGGASATLGNPSPSPAPAPAPAPAATPAPAPAKAAPAPAKSPVPSVVKPVTPTVPSLGTLSTAHSAAPAATSEAPVVGGGATPAVTPAGPASSALSGSAAAHPAGGWPATNSLTSSGASPSSVGADARISDPRPGGVNILALVGMFLLGGLLGLAFASRRPNRGRPHRGRSGRLVPVAV